MGSRLIPLWLGASLAAVPASGQFLRVGPFDFDAVVRLEGVYTTNVENERKSEATAEREDYYVVLALDMLGRGYLSPRTLAEIDTGVAVEKHFNRPDLDNSDNPFGRIEGRTTTEFSRMRLMTHAGTERSSSSATAIKEQKIFIPGESEKTRREATETDYGAALVWQGDHLTVGYAYDFTRERYARDEFKIGDNDDEEYTFDAMLRLRDDLAITYANKRQRTELVNDPDAAKAPWRTTETIDLVWRLEFWRHPKMAYSVGVEKEDTETKKGDWELRHTFTAEDEYDFSRSLRFSFGATYEMEDEEEDTDISLTYHAQLEHDLGRTARHSIGVLREPVDTFGSTKETDRTEWLYRMSKEDLFIYGLDMVASAKHTTSKPLDPSLEDEVALTYELALGNTVRISRRLSRTLQYEYSREDSDQKSEILDEHRVTLSYQYEL